MPFTETLFTPPSPNLCDGFPAWRILNVIGQAAFLDLREGNTRPFRTRSHHLPRVARTLDPHQASLAPPARHFARQRLPEPCPVASFREKLQQIFIHAPCAAIDYIIRMHDECSQSIGGSDII